VNGRRGVYEGLQDKPVTDGAWQPVLVPTEIWDQRECRGRSACRVDEETTEHVKDVYIEGVKRG